MSLSKQEEKRNVLMKHFRNLNLQNGVEINRQKWQLLAYVAVEVEKCMVKSFTLAVSKPVLRLFVNPRDTRLHMKKWLMVGRFWKSGFLNNEGSSK